MVKAEAPISGLQFYANPYGECPGFYFSDLDEYRKKAKKVRCEEFAIEFIDGTREEADLFKAIANHISPYNAVEFLTDVAPGMRDEELAAVYYAIDNNGEDGLDDAIRWAEDEGRPREGDLRSFAEDLIEETGYPENDYYYDYVELGEDLLRDWDEEEQGPEPDDPEQYAIDFVEDMGGWNRISNKEHYFNVQQFANALEAEGSVTEFTFGGRNWTIMD